MKNDLNIFLNKKILVYGLGKSGLSTFNFLKSKNEVFLYDDFLRKNKKIIDYRILLKKKFDYIIISPGIDKDKCKLSKFLKKNSKKIYTDLDIFNAFFKNDCITITGTNGKSTTCKLIAHLLKRNKLKFSLGGNIGTPILDIKSIKNKYVIIEASSFQLSHSKFIHPDYAFFLNLTNDHMDWHGGMKNYLNSI